MKPIIFYDGSCGFCKKSILFFLKRDAKKRFFFATLQGKTAQSELKEWFAGHTDVDSVVLVEKNGEEKDILWYSKAIFRILWGIGGIWAVPGLLSFLPKVLLWPCDVVYRFVAKNRKSLCLLPKEQDFEIQHKDQFLP